MVCEGVKSSPGPSALHSLVLQDGCSAKQQDEEGCLLGITASRLRYTHFVLQALTEDAHCFLSVEEPIGKDG